MNSAKSITELLAGLSCPWRFPATSSCPRWINKALTGVKGPTALPVDMVSAKKSVRLWFSGMLRANFYFLSSFKPLPSIPNKNSRILIETSTENTPVPIWAGGKFHVLLCRYCHVFIDLSPVELRGNICGVG